jgi:hypothetical protein
LLIAYGRPHRLGAPGRRRQTGRCGRESSQSKLGSVEHSHIPCGRARDPARSPARAGRPGRAPAGRCLPARRNWLSMVSSGSGCWSGWWSSCCLRC